MTNLLTLTQGTYFNLNNFIQCCFKSYLNVKQSIFADVQKIKNTKITEPKTLNIKFLDNDNITLNKNLKHLEFISQFEMYLEERNYKNFSIEFLQAFEKMKYNVQLTTLKATEQLNHEGLMAA